jgi:serine phosphatase RsbU (regulator of sigma subunit)
MTTDGITEARRDKEFLGIDGVAKISQRIGSSVPLQELSVGIYTGSMEYAHGVLRDDVCLLLARQDV